MLPCYMGSPLFQHITHLSLLHNVCRILRCILKKCLKICMLLRCLHYTKPPFRKNFIRALQLNLPLVLTDIQMLKKSKSEDIPNLLLKVALTAFYLVVFVISVSSAFFFSSFSSGSFSLKKRSW